MSDESVIHAQGFLAEGCVRCRVVGRQHAVFYWRNPGFEGPGNGKFRFVFPVPED